MATEHNSKDKSPAKSSSRIRYPDNATAQKALDQKRAEALRKNQQEREKLGHSKDLHSNATTTPPGKKIVRRSRACSGSNGSFGGF